MSNKGGFTSVRQLNNSYVHTQRHTMPNQMKRTKAKGFGSSSNDLQSRLEKWRRQTAKAIAEHGRAIVGVLPAETTDYEEGDQSPAFSYTLGNSLGENPFPEIITFYPSAPTQHFVLNNLSDAIKNGEITNVTTETQEVLGYLGEDGSVPIRIRRLTSIEQVWARKEYTCQVPSDTTPIIIAELPDPAGRWADDPDCHPGVQEVMQVAPLRALVTKEAS